MLQGEKRTRRMVAVGFAACALLIVTAYPRSGQASPLRATAPSLGTAASFAVLAGSTVTNTGPTIVNGNLGVSPGSAVTGFPPGIVTPPGTIHAGDAVAAQAQSDTTAAYNSLAGQPCNFNLTGQDLGGKTLIAGVYCFSTSAQLTGPLTLNGQGNPNSVFIFQIGTTLTTASNSSVLLINGASSCNVFWQIGSSATLGTGTAFAGSILALTSNTLNTNAIVNGRVLARNGAVTMDSNRVSSPVCTQSPTSTPARQFPTVPATVAPDTATAIAVTMTAVVATATAVAATATASVATATASAETATASAGTATPSAGTPTVTRTPGVPLAASLVVSRLAIRRSHGVAHLRWYSEAAVRGFDIYNGSTRLNRRPVTSSTHWYHFTTRHAVTHLRIDAIPRHG